MLRVMTVVCDDIGEETGISVANKICFAVVIATIIPPFTGFNMDVAAKDNKDSSQSAEFTEKLAN